MGSYEQIMQLIYDALAEVNKGLEPEHALEKSPDTVLIGESGKLDSMGFVTLVVAVEQNVARVFKKAISLTDVIMAVEETQWTVSALANCIAELVDGSGHDQPDTQVSAHI